MLVEVVSVAKCMAQRRACELLLAADETKGNLATCWTLGFTIRVSYNNLGCRARNYSADMFVLKLVQDRARFVLTQCSRILHSFSYAKSRELVSVRMVH